MSRVSKALCSMLMFVINILRYTIRRLNLTVENGFIPFRGQNLFGRNSIGLSWHPPPEPSLLPWHILHLMVLRYFLTILTTDCNCVYLSVSSFTKNENSVKVKYLLCVHPCDAGLRRIVCGHAINI